MGMDMMFEGGGERGDVQMGWVRMVAELQANG